MNNVRLSVLTLLLIPPALVRSQREAVMVIARSFSIFITGSNISQIALSNSLLPHFSFKLGASLGHHLQSREKRILEAAARVNYLGAREPLWVRVRDHC